MSDGRDIEVRMKSEVKGGLRDKEKQGVDKKPGDDVFADEIGSVDAIELSDRDDPDCGHATILRLPDQWILGFDLVYSKGSARKYLQTAQEFFSAAETAWERHHRSAFIDTLYSAAELSVRALL